MIRPQFLNPYNEDRFRGKKENKQIVLGVKIKDWGWSYA